MSLYTVTNFFGCRLKYTAGNNLVGGIPDEIRFLASATSLIFNDNQLVSLSFRIGDLLDLTNLVVNHNSIAGSIPVSIGNLHNLQSLILHQNSFIGSIPDNFGSLTKLGNVYDTKH